MECGKAFERSGAYCRENIRKRPVCPPVSSPGFPRLSPGFPPECCDESEGKRNKTLFAGHPSLGALWYGSVYLTSPLIDLSSAGLARVPAPHSLLQGAGLSYLVQGCVAGWAGDCAQINSPFVLGNGSVNHEYQSDGKQSKDNNQGNHDAFSPAELAYQALVK